MDWNQEEQYQHELGDLNRNHVELNKSQMQLYNRMLRLEQLSKYTSGSSSEASHSRSSQPPKPPNKVDISSILQKMKQTPHTAAEKQQPPQRQWQGFDLWGQFSRRFRI